MEIAYTTASYKLSDIITLTTPINGTNSYTFGFPQRNVSAVCISHKVIGGKGIWATDNGLTVMPVFLLQLSLSIFLTSSCKFLLKPFSEATIVGQIMGGIIGGPTVLARIHSFLVIVLPLKSLYVLETIATFGCILSQFLLATKMDLGMLRRSGKKEWAIGFSTFAFPMAIIVPASSFLKRYMDIDDRLKSMLKAVALLLASNNFHSIACFLEDLKLLNSDLGRLAMSSAMISGFLNTIVLLILAAQQSKLDGTSSFLQCFSTVVHIMIIGFVVRPLMIWMIKQTAPGEPMKEVYHCSVLLIVLASSLIGEVFGQHGFLGPIWLGLLVPEGSVLAVSLVEKFDGFVSLVMLPLYFLACGVRTDLINLRPAVYYAVQFLGLLGFLTKFLFATFASLCLNLVLKEAVIVGLMLSTAGVLDIQTYSRAVQLGYIDFQCLGVMNVSAMLITGCISPIVKALYDPSVRYTAYTRRTLQHSLQGGGEFRILVCVYNDEHVPNIINLLEASNPTRENPMFVYLLHLVELIGRFTPLLIHESATTPHHNYPHTPVGSIINAFRFFEQSNQGVVSLQAYTAIAPPLTMHNDICTLSYDKRAALIIIPFYIQWNSGGIARQSPSYRGVNLKLIDKAPCSVGIFIDRGNSGWLRPVRESWSHYRIGLLFMGGSDDREALVLAGKMATHPHVSVALIDMFSMGEKTDDVEGKRLDREAINSFRQANAMREKFTYREEILVDPAAACSLIRSMDSDFDLILVGRRTQSPFLVGLSEWNDYPELGLMGDLLASEDFKGKASILVVQQHRFQQPTDSVGYHAQSGINSSYYVHGSSTALRHVDSDVSINQDSYITLEHQNSGSSSAPFRREEHVAAWG